MCIINTYYNYSPLLFCPFIPFLFGPIAYFSNYFQIKSFSPIFYFSHFTMLLAFAVFLIFPHFNCATKTDEPTAVCCHNCYVAFRDCFRACFADQPENLVCVPNCKSALGKCSTEKCGLICPRPKNPQFSPPRKYGGFY